MHKEKETAERAADPQIETPGFVLCEQCEKRIPVEAFEKHKRNHGKKETPKRGELECN